MNKFAGYLATKKNVDAFSFASEIKSQIIDAEMRARNSNTGCTSSDTVEGATNFTGGTGSNDIREKVGDESYYVIYAVEGTITIYKHRD